MNSRTKTLLGLAIPTVLVAAGAATFLSGKAPAMTAEACIGGLASYSKQLASSDRKLGSSAQVDLGALKANLENAGKSLSASEVVTTTDPEVKKLSQLCWQPCQAWASTEGNERAALLSDFRDCMNKSRAQESHQAGPSTTTVIHQQAGDNAVQVGGDVRGVIINKH